MNQLAAETFSDISLRRAAKMAGLCWLITIVAGAFAHVAGMKFVVPADPGATWAKIAASESLYRWAFTANLLACLSYVVAAVLIYALLKPVEGTVSLLAAFFALAGCAVSGAGFVLNYAPLTLLHGAAYMDAFPPAQSHALMLTILRLNSQVDNVAMVFFGLHVLTVGCLIARSSFLPHFLGLLLALTAVCYFANSFATFLALPFHNYLFPLVAAGGLLGEGALTLWLLVAGVNVMRWREEARKQLSAMLA